MYAPQHSDLELSLIPKQNEGLDHFQHRPSHPEGINQ